MCKTTKSFEWAKTKRAEALFGDILLIWGGLIYEFGEDHIGEGDVFFGHEVFIFLVVVFKGLFIYGFWGFGDAVFEVFIGDIV